MAGKPKKRASKKVRSKAKVKSKATMASRADIHALYQSSVQSCEADCELFADIYEQLRNAAPLVLREDFCGTALLSTTWCLVDPEHRAIGVDLDKPTLDWAREHNVEPNAKQLGDRLTLVQGDVLEVSGLERADLIAALNFSFCIFKQRDELARYFGRCHDGLAEGGLLFLELFGGLKAIDTDEEIRELDDFTYVWEQESFNPITNDIVCHIHFRFPDKSKIERAFTYRWRLWSIPELRDLLYEAGFRKVRVYWELVEEEDDDDDDDDDDDGMLSGTGEYEEVEEAEQQDSWLVYVVAEK
ncbi:MAG TPA: class I SAM-dependent methyltransferase [Enhygromyxa sp.]|nr:class I SAM-dependent methyltransferase [Enhygromyxa sp.]